MPKLLDAKVVVNTGGSDSVLGELVTATADVTSTVLGEDVAVCARVNAGDCTDPATGMDTDGSDTSTGIGTGIIPSVQVDAVTDVPAQVTDVVDGVVCARTNGGSCGTTADPTDPGTPTDPSNPSNPSNPNGPATPVNGAQAAGSSPESPE